MSNDLVFPSALLGSLPPHLLCCHSFHSSQHLPRAFHLWCTAGGFVTLGASVPARKICLSRCKRVSEGCIQFFFFPHQGRVFLWMWLLRNSRSQLDTISAGKRKKDQPRPRSQNANHPSEGSGTFREKRKCGHNFYFFLKKFLFLLLFFLGGRITQKKPLVRHLATQQKYQNTSSV